MFIKIICFSCGKGGSRLAFQLRKVAERGNAELCRMRLGGRASVFDNNVAFLLDTSSVTCGDTFPKGKARFFVALLLRMTGF